MTELVVGHDFALARVEESTLFFEPGNDPFDRLSEVHHLHPRRLASGGDQRRLVHQIGQIGAAKPGGELGETG